MSVTGKKKSKLEVVLQQILETINLVLQASLILIIMVFSHMGEEEYPNFMASLIHIGHISNMWGIIVIGSGCLV